jgi:hypothetical protein
MFKIELKHLVRDIDRHGNDRFYFRVKDQEKVRLPGIPGSEEFMETYQDALKKLTDKAGGLQRVREGSSHGFATFASTQRLSKSSWHRSHKLRVVAYLSTCTPILATSRSQRLWRDICGFGLMIVLTGQKPPTDF